MKSAPRPNLKEFAGEAGGEWKYWFDSVLNDDAGVVSQVPGSRALSCSVSERKPSSNMSLSINTIFIAVFALTMIATCAIVKSMMSHVNLRDQIRNPPNIKTIGINANNRDDDYHVVPPWSTDLFARRSTGGRAR